MSSIIDSHVDFDTYTTEDWKSLIESLPETFGPIDEQDNSAIDTTFLNTEDTTTGGDWWNCGILEDASMLPDDLSLTCQPAPIEASIPLEVVQSKLADLEAM